MAGIVEHIDRNLQTSKFKMDEFRHVFLEFYGQELSTRSSVIRTLMSQRDWPGQPVGHEY